MPTYLNHYQRKRKPLTSYNIKKDLFPAPVNGILLIKPLPYLFDHFEILNNNGKKILELHLQKNTESRINLNAFNEGTYFLVCSDANGTILDSQKWTLSAN